jgi:hypothetical protein
MTFSANRVAVIATLLASGCALALRGGPAGAESVGIRTGWRHHFGVLRRVVHLADSVHRRRKLQLRPIAGRKLER